MLISPIRRISPLSIGKGGINPNLWYGYELDEANSSPDVTRIAGTGQMGLHATLPVQSLMRGCLLSDTGIINYYLKADDWTKKADGSASNLDGTDGQVMIEVPRFYHKIENPSAGVYQHKISLYALTGFAEVPKFYYSAFEGALNRTTLKLASVVNNTTTYRGGNNTAAWDAAANTLLGKPATSISMINFQTYARNREVGAYKWNLLPYRQHFLLYLLTIIEFGTLNSQKAVNALLTVDGYRQGGLGNGVTTADGTEWYNFNEYNPFISCGASNVLGNGSGEVSVTATNFGGTGVNRTIKVPRYRGIENPFGHIWKWLDGSSVYHQTAGEGNLHKFYLCDIPQNFAAGTAANYDYRSNLPDTGFVKAVTHDAKGIIIPKTIGGDSVTYLCDYYYSPADGDGYWVALRCGGAAADGSDAGFALLDTYVAASDSDSLIGARLCYIP